MALDRRALLNAYKEIYRHTMKMFHTRGKQARVIYRELRIRFREPAPPGITATTLARTVQFVKAADSNPKGLEHELLDRIVWFHYTHQRLQGWRKFPQYDGFQNTLDGINRTMDLAL